MAMVKANAYGHGSLVASTAFLEGGAQWLGVSSPEEALQLREGGIKAPILNVGWTHPTQFTHLITSEVDLTILDSGSVRHLAAAAHSLGRRARVHLKVDTGMGRLGLNPRRLNGVLESLSDVGEVVELVGLFTHFADADGTDPKFTALQHQRFLVVAAKVQKRWPTVALHCANSAWTLASAAMHHDLVRVGIALYGYPPQAVADQLDVRPALAMYAYVTQVKTVEAGDSVGYGRTWFASRPTHVATVAAGYADGVQRAQSNVGHVLIRGSRCPIIGRVSMDHTTVDISAVEGVVIPGERATLIGIQNGAQLRADEVGSAVGTIPYEVLCNISGRVPRLLARHVKGAT